MNKKYNDLFEATANSLNIPITKYNKIIEPKSDHTIFRRYARRHGKTLQIVFFHSDKDSKYIHSLRDTPDKCSEVVLNNCINIIYSTILDLDVQLTSQS